MAIVIENNGTSLKITEDGASRFILKNQIRGVEIVRDSIIKIDVGQGALNNIFFDQTAVISPASTGVENLRSQIMDLIQTNVSGIATEANQNKEIEAVKALQNSIKDVSNNVNAVGDKIFYEPSLIDESNPNAIYNGYAAPGSNTSDAVWAIQKVTKVKDVVTYQWAGGNKAFDKIWNKRTTIVYC